MLKHLLFWGLLIGGVYYFWTTRPVTYGPGVVAPSSPVQRSAFGVKSIDYKTYTVRPLKEITLEARVLSKKRYYSDKHAEIAPFDFVLGWGPMSDERNLDHILIKQGDRSFYWEMTKPPIPQVEMRKHTVNVHLAPPNNEIYERLNSVRKGHVVKIRGYLVEINSQEGWRLSSELRDNLQIGMNDSAVIWIEEFSIR